MFSCSYRDTPPMELWCSTWEIEASIEVTTAGAKLNSNAICGVEVALEFLGVDSLSEQVLRERPQKNYIQSSNNICTLHPVLII
jgi:hypothetical protein